MLLDIFVVNIAILLQESFIDRNNEILYFKKKIHNQSTKLDGFI